MTHHHHHHGVSKHPKMTDEMYLDVMDIFKALSEDYHGNFPADKLILGLTALGFNQPNDATVIRAMQTETVDMKEFCKVIADHMETTSGWCANEILESYHVFDNYDHGYIDAAELKRVFAKLGEKLTDEEIKDQIGEMIDSNSSDPASPNAKGRITLSNYFRILLHTSGSDFEFDD